MNLPVQLLTEPPTVKVVYLWLLPQGVVSLGAPTIAKRLGLQRAKVHGALTSLEELRLVEWTRSPGPTPGTIRVKGVQAAGATAGRPTRNATTPDGVGPSPILPASLLPEPPESPEPPTVKLLFLWGKPGTVRATARELGIAQKSVQDARVRLRELGLER